MCVCMSCMDACIFIRQTNMTMSVSGMNKYVCMYMYVCMHACVIILRHA